MMMKILRSSGGGEGAAAAGVAAGVAAGAAEVCPCGACPPPLSRAAPAGVAVSSSIMRCRSRAFVLGDIGAAHPPTFARPKVAPDI